MNLLLSSCNPKIISLENTLCYNEGPNRNARIFLGWGNRRDPLDKLGAEEGGMEGWKLEGVDWVGWVWEVGWGWDTDGESNKKRLLDGGAFED